MSTYRYKARASRRHTFEIIAEANVRREFDALHTDAFVTPIYPDDWPADGVDVLITVAPIETIPEKED